MKPPFHSLCIVGAAGQLAHGALVMTFSQSGSDVLLTVSGSIDLRTATFVSDSNFFKRELAFLHSGGIDLHNFSGVDPSERLQGTDLLSVPFMTLSSGVDGAITAGSGSFKVNGRDFYTYQSTDGAIVRDGLLNAGVSSSNQSAVYANFTIASLGLGHHAMNTNIPVWRASAAAGDDGTLFLRVVDTVPEPSSGLLGTLAGCALLMVRRR